MKANKSSIYSDRKEAGVSAVLGVILMVAVTVAIASVVYVYASGFVGKQQNTTPDIAFLPKPNAHQLIVTSVSGEYDWEDFTFTVSGTATNHSLSGSTIVMAGDTVTLTNSTGAATPGTLTITYNGVSLMGEWKL